MRTIKFRAWNIQQQKMLEVSSLLFKDGVQVGTYNKVNVSPDHHYYPSDENILMQFTGLLDKKGVEIYEGDIIEAKPSNSRWNPLICKIVFNSENARFEAQQYWVNKDKWISLSNSHNYYEYKVIGNIHQNKYLL